MPFEFTAAVRAPFRIGPGLRRLEGDAPQLTPTSPDDPAFLEKLRVLEHWPGQALLQVPGFDAAPALRTIAARAALEHPGAFSLSASGAITAHQFGCAVEADGMLHAAGSSGSSAVQACLSKLAPEWRLAALLSLGLREDFAVLDADTARVPWLAVCLPSQWAPEEKIGGRLDQIHAPIPESTHLRDATAHLARLVCGDERWERFVWTVTDDARLSRHPRRRSQPAWQPCDAAEAVAAKAFFRTERQSFLPIAGARQAVFTIKVELRPLQAAVASPGDALRLQEALATMSPALLEYRGLADVRDRLVDWLRTRGQSPVDNPSPVAARAGL